MTRKEYQQIQNRLDALERELKRLRGESRETVALLPAHEFETLSGEAVVGKDYVAWRFGCSLRAVLNDPKFKLLPRISNSPLKFVKADVDRLFEKSKKLPVEKRAAEEIKKARKRIYSIVGKS